VTEIDSSCAALAHWAEQTPTRVFLTQPLAGEVREWTFREAYDDALRLANGLLGLGLQPGDKVALLSKNCAEWVLADIAMAMAGLVSVPIYPTAGRDTVTYVMQHSEAVAIIIGRLDNPSVAVDALNPETITIGMRYAEGACQHGLDDLIASNEPLTARQQPEPDETMTILYTSGSTGRPKGVVLSYGAYRYACTACVETYGMGAGDRILSYLPLAHITERAASVGPAIFGGTPIYFTDKLDTFVEDLKRARVTMFISVPRLWVQFQAGVHRKISPKKLSFMLAIPFLGPSVAARIREQLGFSHCSSFGSGSAPISPLTLRWFERIGIPISEGWGMSETCGLSCTNLPFRSERIGTIGEPIPGTELRISDEGEILIRAPGLLTEYYKQPDLTNEAFTDDGFFRTGDKGEWDERVRGFRITGRVKDQFKSAKGKYVSPVPIEGKLAGNPLIEQVCVMGTGLRAPVAVVVLSVSAKDESRDVIRKSLLATLDSVNATLEGHEKMSHLVVTGEPWTIENELLTPTMKIKREQLEAKYAAQIARLDDQAVVWLEDG
jgi:long-subunit acyl-CoA synthetase (AMP-forming)